MGPWLPLDQGSSERVVIWRNFFWYVVKESVAIVSLLTSATAICMARAITELFLVQTLLLPVP